MKNFLTGAFLVFTGATVSILTVMVIITIIMTIAPFIPHYVQLVLFSAATVTIVGVGALNMVGESFYNWKNSK
ncbi:MAG: hypothetical protein EOO61_03390 [Hymenobacter sp.]|nr:MAG: hypothetical protein EOO61_03390 [Hymenobacter sp.]